MSYDDPKRYEWSPAQREDYNSTFWSCPVDLVLDPLGAWRDVWELCPSATSLLPILAVDAFPAMRVDHFARDLRKMGRTLPLEASSRVPEGWPASDPPYWTMWAYSSRRRMAALSGLNKDSVKTALGALREMGWLETINGPRKQYGGGTKTYYRLRIRELYPSEHNPEYIEFPAKLLFSGLWAMLPTSSARHLYFVIAARDAVRHEKPFIEATHEGSEALDYGEPLTPEEKSRLLSSARRHQPFSLADMERASGMGYRTVSEALGILTKPLFSSAGKKRDIALVMKGETSIKNVSWYAPDRTAWTWSWNVDALNRGKDWWESERRSSWPELYAKRDNASKRKAG